MRVLPQWNLLTWKHTRRRLNKWICWNTKNYWSLKWDLHICQSLYLGWNWANVPRWPCLTQIGYPNFNKAAGLLAHYHNLLLHNSCNLAKAGRHGMDFNATSARYVSSSSVLRKVFTSGGAVFRSVCEFREVRCVGLKLWACFYCTELSSCR